ncbi:LacI family DNA-binding transcriptional regulator [Fonticella tunisiensis]|uniref:LacI family transcriptional regulator n=1 Tax=Fonticella tunisiensis TaxID=1096341 RepID=A0A4V3ET03_9CLOT|nr:LacI family DNA-binding transcriptional regulator [Fonticella tunisiensis]TDT56507.1 LacI family transcriptional regulator [Fonticella tunisiensis]
MTVTIKDIAKIAGVSHATVSRSLNDSPLVAEKTKKRIKELADNLGFEFNANARSLSTNKTGTVCAIFPQKFGEFGASLYYISLLNQLRTSLEEEGIDLIVSFPKSSKTGESNIKRLIISKKVDGIIIIHPRLEKIDGQIINFMELSKIPYIFLHHYSSFYEENLADSIYTDHFYGGYNATDYLIKLGHKKIMCITSVGNSYEFEQRLNGYKAALNQNNIPVDENLILFGYRDIASGYNLVRDNIKSITDKGVTAIFAHTDLMAIGAMEALKEFNIKVPDDVSIVGYDDIELAEDFKPALTTIHQPREEIALLGCKRIVEMINGKKIKNKINIVLQTRLVVRESTKQIK